MIKEKIMYTVICDNCGKDSNDGTDYSCWSDSEQAELVADNSGWLLFEYSKHYCPDCISYDDEDNLVLKNIEK